MRRRRIGRGTRIAAGLLIILIIALTAGGISMAVIANEEGRSFGSKAVELLMAAAMRGKSDRTEEDTAQLIADAGEKNETYKVPALYKTLFGFETDKPGPVEVCYFGSKDAKTVIYYLHGGAFIYQPTLFHFRFCRLLAKELDARIVMPIYPKAPEYQYEYTLSVLAELYASLTEEYPAADLVIMGDSAGGSLTLTLGQYVVENGMRAPSELIAISPCLDMTLSNPQIAEYAKYDPMLAQTDLQIKFESYFGSDIAKESYLVSPMYCDYALLPPVTVIVGTHELFLPDARALKARLDAESTDIRYFEYDTMDHTFPLFPIPEAKEAMEQIKEIIE